MKNYKTSEVAQLIGIHPNTVRLYEELELIPKPMRRSNGYRVFTDYHIEQFRLARTALKVEVLQNGLRKKAVQIVKTSAAGDLETAGILTQNYLRQIEQEQKNAKEAIEIVTQLLSGTQQENNGVCMIRKQTADYLQISMDTLRNWELNGLLSVKRKQNGYRIYTNEDVRQLKIIRALRCANYSLAAILRMLTAISVNPQVNIKSAIDTPQDNDDIISACDKLLTSLESARENASEILTHLEHLEKLKIENPPS